MDQDAYWRAVDFIEKIDRNAADTYEVGWVYAIRNTEFRRPLLKIGMTWNPPHVRAEQLASTGVPGFFELVYCVHTVNARVAESYAHQELAEFRLQPNKEFFEAPIGRVVGVFDRIAFSWPVRTSLGRSGRYNERSKALDQPFQPVVLKCSGCGQSNRARRLAIRLLVNCAKCGEPIGRLQGIYANAP
jgi:hypothetical protein